MVQLSGNLGPAGPATAMSYFPVDGMAVASTSTATVMVNAQNVFTVAGGPILITNLVSIATTANDTTASTLQWSATGSAAGQTATTFTGATSTLASTAIGDSVVCNLTALSTAPAITATGTSAALGAVLTRGVIVFPGTINLVIGVGSTTGKWNHILQYCPLPNGAPAATGTAGNLNAVTVTSAF